MKKKIIGIMGPGPGATAKDLDHAYTLGRIVAEEGWILLTGGMNIGVMDAASRGAGEAGGLVVGILPTGDRSRASKAVDVPIVTDMGSSRNNINVLSSDVVIACGMGPGTASEIALALKAGRKVILLNDMEESRAFFRKLSSKLVFPVSSPAEAIDLVKEG